jgi:hypothetical protein
MVGEVAQKANTVILCAATLDERPEPNIPQELKPGAQWMGLAHPDEKLRAILESGSAYVAIYTTSLDRPFLKRIEKPAEPPVDAEKVE